MEATMAPSDDVVPLHLVEAFLTEGLGGFVTLHSVSILAKGEIASGRAASMGIDRSDGAVFDIVKSKMSAKSGLYSVRKIDLRNI
jgi:hypothetical protein